MWVRVVVAALAVLCVSETALAAGYTEVWNPPEASGHAAKSAKKKAAAGKVSVGSKAAAKGDAKADAKAGSKHAAGAARHAASSRQTSTAGVHAGVAHGGKLAAHDGMKKVAAKSTAKSHAKTLTTGKPRSGAVVTAQAKKPHVPLAQAKAGQGKIVHANLVQSRGAHLHTVEVAAKPAASHIDAPAASANVGGAALQASTNPATASSGSLPPILH
jgi:hypothetical protein